MTLKDRLVKDLKTVGLNIDGVEIVIRPYSKTLWGRYYPSQDNARIFVYPFTSKNTRLVYPYRVVYETALHELIHHKQWTNPNFRRLKGVMHDPEFFKMYNHYLEKSEELITWRN